MFLLECTSLWCNPTGPGTPFGTWYIAIFDSCRVLCVIVSMWLISEIAQAWRRSFAHGGQRDRYAALGLFAFIVIANEVSSFGDIASYRLVLSVLAVLLAVRGLRRFRFEQPAIP